MDRRLLCYKNAKLRQQIPIKFIRVILDLFSILPSLVTVDVKNMFFSYLLTDAFQTINHKIKTFKVNVSNRTQFL